MNKFNYDINDLKVVYEDNHIIVIVKPVGIASQADKTGDIDILTIVKEYIKVKYEKPGNVYLGLVHRLDRMVGGLMVFAKTSKAASRISMYIRERNFKKKYSGIVNGKLEGSKTLTNYLLKNEKLNLSSVVTKNSKNEKYIKEAILDYTCVKSFKFNNKDYTLVNVDLKTGRHHQIRVQLSNIGYPLYGDVKYGSDINKVGQNLALWSNYLSFYHPTKDEYLEFNLMPNEVESNKLYKIDKIWDNI